MRNILKKISLTVIACFIGTFLFAQQQKQLNQADIEKKAATKTAVMKQQLNLREEQEKSIGELTRTIALKSAQGQQPQAELDEYYNAEVAKILDGEQLQKFEAMKKEDVSTAKEQKSVNTKSKSTHKK